MAEQGELDIGQGSEQSSDGVSKTDFEAAQRRAKEAEQRAAKLEDADNKRRDKEKKAAEKAALERGEHEQLLKNREEENERLRSDIKKQEESMQARADNLFEKLNDAQKSRITKYKDKLSLTDWLEMVEDEASTAPTSSEDSGEGDGQTQRMQSMPTPGRKKQATDKRNLQPKSYEILDEMAHSSDMGEDLRTEKDPESSNVKFYMPIKKMLAKMRVDKGANLTREEAERRR